MQQTTTLGVGFARALAAKDRTQCAS